jgi:hypothetical protein
METLEHALSGFVIMLQWFSEDFRVGMKPPDKDKYFPSVREAVSSARKTRKLDLLENHTGPTKKKTKHSAHTLVLDREESVATGQDKENECRQKTQNRRH